MKCELVLTLVGPELFEEAMEHVEDDDFVFILMISAEFVLKDLELLEEFFFNPFR